MKTDKLQIQIELEGIAAQLLALRLQFDADADRLTDETMQNALFAMQQHILRIVEDIDAMEMAEE